MSFLFMRKPERQSIITSSRCCYLCSERLFQPSPSLLQNQFEPVAIVSAAVDLDVARLLNEVDIATTLSAEQLRFPPPTSALSVNQKQVNRCWLTEREGLEAHVQLVSVKR